MTIPKPETAANTAVMFTAEDWALLRSLPKLLTDFVEASTSRHETNELAIKSANDRLDAIQSDVRAMASIQTRWGAFGAGVCAVIVAAWAGLKFWFNRG